MQGYAGERLEATSELRATPLDTRFRRARM